MLQCQILPSTVSNTETYKTLKDAHMPLSQKQIWNKHPIAAINKLRVIESGNQCHTEGGTPTTPTEGTRVDQTEEILATITQETVILKEEIPMDLPEETPEDHPEETPEDHTEVVASNQIFSGEVHHTERSKQ